MPPIRFRKALIADTRYESAAVFDVNNDGIPDIVCGEYWYEGPNWSDPKRQHRIGEVKAIGEYFDDFSTIPMDVNGDGYLDFITGGWWGEALKWRENPGRPDAEWPEHIIAQTGPIETTRAWDVDGDGALEVVPNTPGDPLVVYKLVTDAAGRGTGLFSHHLIYPRAQGHGLGFGDINGDGRGDFVLRHGWLEAPPDPFHGEWILHEDFDLGSASVPILVVDVNGDGLNDLIVGQAHDYGLDWYEQARDATGRRTWRKHPIDPYNSQYHDLIWADLDGDGACELVTGKRYRAHNGRDPGEYDDYGLYYFKWSGKQGLPQRDAAGHGASGGSAALGGSFSKQVIDYGPARVATGCGIHFAVADLRETGRLDIIAPGKDGLYVFFNEGP